MAYRVIIIAVVVFIHQTSSMLIPQDIEILDGYEMEGSPELYPPDSYFEARSLADSLLLKAIRNKRSPLYHVLTSPGLRSHFQIASTDPDNRISVDRDHIDSKIRLPRSLDETIERQPRNNKDENLSTPSSLPTPAKQFMESEFYRKGNWNVQTFNTDYLPKSETDDGDSVPDASINEGIKSRQPRVNFITQPKKNNGEDSKDRLTSIMPNLPPQKSRYEKIETRMPESYPSRSYDPYLRRYDRYDEEYNRYDPYDDYYLYRRRYDPYDSYSPRMPSYPEPYYDYPDRRYDTPEPRSYRPMYSNDIYDRPASYTPPYEGRSRNRIIYYAHLPEVVRAPPSVDLTYRHARDRYDSTYAMRPMSDNYQMDNSNRGNTEFVKREKKDHRPYEAVSKMGTRSTVPAGRE